MSVHLSAIGNAFQFFNTNGRPLSLGLLYTFAAGTSTPASTYTDNTGLAANTNPIILDASGRVPGEVWLTDGAAYKFVLKDSGGSTIGTYDNIIGINDPTGLVTTAALASTIAPTGASLVGYKSTATSAVSTTVQERLQNTIDVIADYTAVGNGVTDDTGALQAAITASAGGLLRLVAGKTYLVSGLTVPANTTIDLTGATIKQAVLGNLVGTPVFTVQGTGCVFLGGGSGTINGQRGSQPANGFSDSFNSGANGTGRAFRAAIMADQVSFASIASLTVRGVVFTGQYGACVATRDVPNVAVEDCVATSTNFELAACYRSAATLNDASFVRNRMNSLASGDATVNADCLYAARYSRVVIADNKATNFERTLCKLESCTTSTVTGNVADTNTKQDFPAIQLDGTNTLQFATVTGNALSNVQKGVLLSSGTYNGVLIANNVIWTTTGATTGDGIAVGAASITGLNICNNLLANIKRHGIFVQGQMSGISIEGNNVSGQGIAGTYAIALVATAASTDVILSRNICRSFEQSAVGLGTVNFTQSGGAFSISNIVLQGNCILAGGAANRGLRSSVDMLASGILADNYIDGIMEFQSAGPRYHNNRTTGAVSLPAGTANVETIGATATTIGAAGAASALPANPLGYSKSTVNGTTVSIPYYNP